jgi:hypothetical protein
MTEGKQQIKLVGRRQIILMVVAVCAGVGLGFPLMFSLKGHLGTTEVAAMVCAGVLGLSIVGFMAWYANKPQKGTKAGVPPEPGKNDSDAPGHPGVADGAADDAASLEYQEKMELWNRKFGKLMKVLFLILLLLGILRLCMGFFE